MKVLIAPLNWGLGHATRCIPLIHKFLQEGHEVVLAGNGASLLVLKSHFPTLRSIPLPAFEVRYSHKNNQVGAMFRMLPQIIYAAFSDKKALKKILQHEHFDQVISDNRFGLFSNNTHCIYISHQLMIKMPRRLQWAESIAWRIHRLIISKYNECWVPDTKEGGGLSGDLSHKYPLSNKIKFIGTLSRFALLENIKANNEFDIVALLSGVEPQRSMFEKDIISKHLHRKEKVLLIQGKVSEAQTQKQIGNITIATHIPDKQLASYLLGAEKIIARSGYSSIMDFDTIGVLHNVEFTATPGQTEQEYLATHIKDFRNKETLLKLQNNKTKKSS